MSTVEEAMRAVPRADFLPAGQRRNAGRDVPLPIGHGATNSQPSTVRTMLELLDVHHGHRVLDVGSGSGWTTAILARLTGPSGQVVGVELEPALADWGASNLAAAGVGWARIEAAEPGVLGRPDAGPFDRVLVSAEAAELPTSLVEQLVAGGLMVAPVRGRMLRVCRPAAGPPQVETFGHYRFVPLR